MAYKISGITSDAGRAHIIKDGEYMGYKDITSGNYDLVFDSASANNVMAVAEKSGGETVGFGGVAAVSTGDSPNLTLPAFSYAQILKTNQTTSYGTGDDGDLENGVTPDRERVTISGGEVVRDSSTALMWVADPEGAGCNNGNSQNWAAALSFANSLTFAGFSDWRMPNVNELASLILWQAEASTGFNIETLLFGYLGGGDRFPDRRDFWTSTTVSNSTTYAWIVNVDALLINKSYVKTTIFPLVRPVRDI